LVEKLLEKLLEIRPNQRKKKKNQLVNFNFFSIQYNSISQRSLLDFTLKKKKKMKKKNQKKKKKKKKIKKKKKMKKRSQK